MVNFRQVVFSLLASPFSRTPHYTEPNVSEPPSKSVAIIGAGSAGLAVLKTFLDLPQDVRRNWDITLYEQRRNVGGVWLPDPNPVSPPELPETPLYPRLHTNTPVPAMTYPGFPYPPNTPMFPPHTYVEQYHQDYASHHNLTSHILLNHTVTTSNWVGNSSAGYWNITVSDNGRKLQQKRFDHLVVASGHNHHPHIPTWPGQEEWLANSASTGPKREILHSIWYRSPERYSNRSVVVVGSGASGRDASSQIVEYARKIYQSVRNVSDTFPDVIVKPEISHFTLDAVVFKDGSSTSDVDALLLGTGYDLRLPFLENGHSLSVDPSADSNETYTQGLVTNLRYLFPVYKHVLSLCPHYPTNALSFIGLPIYVANCPSDIAQSIFVVNSIANASILPPRKELVDELARDEEWLRTLGYDPYNVGHRLVPLNGTQWEYANEIVDFVKKRGSIPDDGKPFVEAWRREERKYLKRGWQRVEELGTQAEWLQGVETEEDWADLMGRLDKWEAEWEESQGLYYADEEPVRV